MKWLVVSYYARMPGACQAEWIDDRIVALKSLGDEISLVSSVCAGPYPDIENPRVPSLSPADLNYEVREIVARRQDHSAAAVSWSRIIAKAIVPLVWIEAKLLRAHGEGRWSWIPTGTFAGLSLALRKRHDLIFSTGGPASAHVVAIILGKILRKPVFAELQDPLVGPDIGRNPVSRVGLLWAEKFIFRFADKVIFCTQKAAEVAKERATESARPKILCIYPGSWKRQLQAKPADKEKLTFVYLGSLYQTRNLDRLMEALLNLKKKGFDLEGKMEIKVYGNMNPDIRKRIEAFPLPLIKLLPLVPREDALQVAQDADVLLLIQNTDDRSCVTIPFKTYDYLQSGSLILGLIYKNEELSSMLEKNGHLACNAHNTAEIETALQSILEGRSRAVNIPSITPVDAAKEMMALADGYGHFYPTKSLAHE